MKKILQFLFEHKTLSREVAKEVLTSISKGIYNDHEVTAFVTVYLLRSITIEELQGFRDALLDLSVKVDLNGYKTMDIVGTGGDGKIRSTFQRFLFYSCRCRPKGSQTRQLWCIIH